MNVFHLKRKLILSVFIAVTFLYVSSIFEISMVTNTKLDEFGIDSVSYLDVYRKLLPKDKNGSPIKAKLKRLAGEEKINAVYLQIGLPTIMRKEMLLYETLQSLFVCLHEDRSYNLTITVFIGEQSKDQVSIIYKELVNRFSKQIQMGVLEVIELEIDYPTIYDNFMTLVDPLSKVDESPYTVWRYRQNLHFMELWKYMIGRSEYYMQLEDDVIATKDYLKIIKHTIESHKEDSWYELQFSNLGYIGKLYRNERLYGLIAQAMLYRQYLPIDWTVRSVMITTCLLFDMKPQQFCDKYRQQQQKSEQSLFQHKGIKSSLEGKIQHLVDSHFLLTSCSEQTLLEI